MKILFEEYEYITKDVENVLQGLLSSNEKNQQKFQLSNVGYYYDKEIVNPDNSKGDLVFILPKVLLDNNLKAFGMSPEDLINFNLKEWNADNTINVETNFTKRKVYEFIYGFATWVYRAVDIYRKNQTKKNKNDDNAGIRTSLQIGKGGQKNDVTFFDILLSLTDFQKQHRNFITFIIKMSHSGFNKVSWPKTIAQTQAVVQDESPIYLNPINKQRLINFDEELLIIYFSILDYIHEEYGCPILNQPGYKLIKGAKFDSYLKGQGKARLHKIRYKYYSDEAILLWNLCYNFFDKSNKLRTQTNGSDYLFVNKFEVVFEAMIDELIGDKDLPEDLKVQRDDKRIDHLYTYKYLIENLEGNNEEWLRDIYHIADSKYYGRDSKLQGHDVPKQFTYARNVIQWHMDLLHGLLKIDNEDQKYDDIKLFDKVTEGYNIIPNFFISGIVKNNLNYENDELEFSTLKNTKNPQESFFFWERLFDRNTLFTLHYDVNFLYVLKMYAQNKSGAKATWKAEVRQKFREKILEILNKEFVFYQIIIPYDESVPLDEDKLIKAFVDKYFRQLIGKVFCFDDAEGNRVLLYAERKHQEKGNGKSYKYTDETCSHVDEGTLYIPAAKGFDLYRVTKLNALGESKYQNTDERIESNRKALVGYCVGIDHFNWIKENGIYNMRVKGERGNFKLGDDRLFATHLILHNLDLGIFQVFDIVSPTIHRMKKVDLPKGEYEPKHEEYFTYKVEVSQKLFMAFDVLLKTSNFEKLLKKKSPQTINLSKLKLLEKEVEESAHWAVIKPIDALRYKLEDEAVFYSLVAEPQAEYGKQIGI